MRHNRSELCAVIGTQWGDEGKGKIIDALAENFDIIARAAGGANAGHTIYIGDKKHVFHLLPSGCLYEHTSVVLGTGMVIHLPTLLEEIHTLKKSGVDILPRLKISRKAHIVMDYHILLDAWNEKTRAVLSGQKIGTTLRGIGPAYADKINRVGLRLESLLRPDIWKQTVNDAATRLNNQFDITVDQKQELTNMQHAADVIGDLLTDTESLLADSLDSGKRVLIEGAQATLLDIDHGSYPFVTSSSTTLAGALQGLGLAPSYLQKSYGVVKAYCTRVGNGDFPTECDETDGKRLRDNGNEYGATTGRPRRCGWLDLVALNQAIRINGLSTLALTKLDVLDSEPVIRICTAYTKNGKPRYRTFKGWQQPTTKIESFNKLPRNAQAYIQFIEKETKTSISLIGVGKERSALIIR